MKCWRVERSGEGWLAHKPGGQSYRFDDLSMARLFVISEGGSLLADHA